MVDLLTQSYSDKNNKLLIIVSTEKPQAIIALFCNKNLINNLSIHLILLIIFNVSVAILRFNRSPKVRLTKFVSVVIGTRGTDSVTVLLMRTAFIDFTGHVLLDIYIMYNFNSKF